MRTINIVDDRSHLRLPPEIFSILEQAKSVYFPKDRDEVFRLALGGTDGDVHEVIYDVPGQGPVTEATVVRCKNGLSVNYIDPSMRRRDPDCMVIGDALPSDKCYYSDRFGAPFDAVRTETFEWLKQQDLCVMTFILGGHGEESGMGAMLIAPSNAVFFLGALADLQGILSPTAVPENFQVNSIIFLAPPFRHTHFDGRQVVVHNRTENIHEVFAYNLYPGPSAKKGVYGVLLNIGEETDQVTLHGSTVQVVTPYDNVTTFMHEGASGAGKSEMLEHVHRQKDGRIRIGKNVLTGDERRLTLNQACTLHPVTDDMAMCYNDNPGSGGRGADGYLTVFDAEQAWFVRVDHITHYGTDPHLESLTIHPSEPLLFLNFNTVPHSTCLIWDHIEDAPGKRCPNPRVILPRHLVPFVVDKPVNVMIRNFGIRTPPCTAANPSYGIVGYLHILPPALAWIWRLVAPRGHANPSITVSEGLSSEGVGSYWPFATGCMVDHANILLRQIRNTPSVQYTLTPNQHIGAWEVSFMPQWVAREYLSRRGTAHFPEDRLQAARCSLLGYTPKSMQIEGATLPSWLLRVEEQAENRTEGYDAGAKLLVDFFHHELRAFLQTKLDPVGRRIIECCLDNGLVGDYEALLP
ncbi:MAG: DUF4914 family protein [Planctomycetaceae bacterium]|nr:DUF4914 family protein [Planctomycetaceae bacterium]